MSDESSPLLPSGSCEKKIYESNSSSGGCNVNVGGGLKKSTVRHYDNAHVSWLERRKRKKLVQEYYENLNKLTDLYERDRQTIEGAQEGIEIDKNERRPDRILARICVLLNVVLMLANLAASYLSGSLAIVSAFVDSLMDVTSGLILGICLWLIHNTDAYKYPRGRARLEIVGVILCSIIMGIANIVVIFSSIMAIIGKQEPPVLDIPTLSIMIGGMTIKIVLMFVCYKRATTSSMVLAMDMRNDIATTLVALFCAFLGSRFWSYADPVGAILICSLIAISWFRNASEYIPSLVGIRAEGELLSRILKVVIEHSDLIKQIDFISVYHTSLECIVEVHIVMDDNLPLRVTHNVAHPLEKKLLSMEGVERAFVHVDYALDGE